MKASPPRNPDQLELFPGFDTRQRPLWSRGLWSTAVDVRIGGGQQPIAKPKPEVVPTQCDRGDCPCPGCIASLAGDGT